MNFLRHLELQGKKLDDSSRRNVVETEHIPDMLLSLFPSLSGYGLISTPVVCFSEVTTLYSEYHYR